MEKNHFEKKVWIFFRRFSIFPNLGSGCQIPKNDDILRLKKNMLILCNILCNINILHVQYILLFI